MLIVLWWCIDVVGVWGVFIAANNEQGRDPFDWVKITDKFFISGAPHHYHLVKSQEEEEEVGGFNPITYLHHWQLNMEPYTE